MKEIPGNAHIGCKNLKSLNIKGDAYGIRMGWFFWPHHFDPVWLKECDGFETKEDI